MNPPFCLCGKVATATCGELWPPVTLTLCNAPLCRTDCKFHRHEAGSMGYPKFSGGTQYEGDEPDGDGAWEWLKSRCREWFWTPQQKAQRAYEEICDNFPPPAPWPHVQLKVGRHTFEAKEGSKMLPIPGLTLVRRSIL